MDNLIFSFLGLEHNTFLEAFTDFRKFCASVDPLPTDLHIILSDIICGRGTVMDLFPYFLQHARKVNVNIQANIISHLIHKGHGMHITFDMSDK